MQATARRLSVVSATSCARRRLIRDVSRRNRINPANAMMRHVSEILDDWLDWPGKPFGWRQGDSPIQNEFFRYLHKFANDQCALRWEHEVDTDAGTFRLDFLLTHRSTGRAIGIECDGRDFHSVARDSKRDEAIMRTRCVAEIYRVRGKDCHHCGLDVLQLIAQREPWIASDAFHQQATFQPPPTTYRDEAVACLEGGYNGLMRTYYDYVERDDEVQAECFCEGECDCSSAPEVEESRIRTPTLIRFMSAPGHPSAFAVPERIIPVPMPAWKRELAQQWRNQNANNGG